MCIPVCINILLGIFLSLLFFKFTLKIEGFHTSKTHQDRIVTSNFLKSIFFTVYYWLSVSILCTVSVHGESHLGEYTNLNLYICFIEFRKYTSIMSFCNISIRGI